MTTPTPRTDELVYELRRIKAGYWAIDLISLAEELERDLAAALEESAKLRAFVSQPHLRYEYEAFCADFPKE